MKFIASAHSQERKNGKVRFTGHLLVGLFEACKLVQACLNQQTGLSVPKGGGQPGFSSALEFLDMNASLG